MNDRIELRDADWLWRQISTEGVELSRAEPMLASFFHASLLEHSSLASALAFLLAHKLGDRDMLPMSIRQVCADIYRDNAAVVAAGAADICAHFDRDPACVDYATPLLHYKGFHALQAYRVAHALWLSERRSLALFLQYRIATVFDVDIHPAATIGSGIMIDHATGVVIGETASVADNVSMLHSVSLGGSGCGPGRRHPAVEEGVLIAAGAKLLGPIRIGTGAKIAAGSVVLADVPAHSTVAGVPARLVGSAVHTGAHTGSETQPALSMDQGLNGD
ncbi:MAG: serine O-acetyltransferase [Spongiibacteraceae bacterium]